MSGWKGSRRRAQLPKNWPELREQTKARASGQCEAMSQITDDGIIHAEGTRCWRPGTDCDHKSDRWNHDDLQWLCGLHHDKKTQMESLEARRRLGPVKRPEEPHPGRLR